MPLPFCGFHPGWKHCEQGNGPQKVSAHVVRDKRHIQRRSKEERSHLLEVIKSFDNSCPWAELCMVDYLASNLPHWESMTTLFLIFRPLIVSWGVVQNGLINFLTLLSLGK